MTEYLRLPSEDVLAHSIDDLERELFAERWADEQTLRAERFGAPVLLTEVRCWRCGQLGCQDSEGRWVHIAGDRCTKFEVFQSERPL